MVCKSVDHRKLPPIVFCNKKLIKNNMAKVQAELPFFYIFEKVRMLHLTSFFMSVLLEK